MSPPPSTPTPRRFLVAKRATQSSQTPTGPPRFHSTARFSSSSVPRPTQSRPSLDIEDSFEEGFADEGSVTRRRGLTGGSIEIESDDVMPHGQVQCESDARTCTPDPEDEEEPLEISPVSERDRKRRKLTVSPLPTSPAPVPAPITNDPASPLSEHSPSSRPSTPPYSSTESVEITIPTRKEQKSIQQPTFQAPPRFKPIETDPAFEGLPAAFSPQRRGAKYTTGGLAAQLQGWLSDVKGWESSATSLSSAMVLVVSDVSPGPRMYLASGLVNDQPRRFLLAGEGKLTGLGRRAIVDVGSAVEIDRPVWDVEMDGYTWTVACDWSVCSKE